MSVTVIPFCVCVSTLVAKVTPSVPFVLSLWYSLIWRKSQWQNSKKHYIKCIVLDNTCRWEVYHSDRTPALHLVQYFKQCMNIRGLSQWQNSNMHYIQCIVLDNTCIWEGYHRDRPPISISSSAMFYLMYAY